MIRVGRGFLFLTTMYDKDRSSMASGSGSGSRSGSGSDERLKYVDRDASTPSSKDPWDKRSLTTSSNPLTSSRGEQEVQENKESKPARKRVWGCNTGVCVAILQAVVIEDAELGVLG